jgi:hypothetical protein
LEERDITSRSTQWYLCEEVELRTFREFDTTSFVEYLIHRELKNEIRADHSTEQNDQRLRNKPFLLTDYEH